MKRLLLLTLVLPLIGLAQERGDIELGPTVGLNFGTFYGDTTTQYALRTDYQAGISAEYYFSDRLSLRTGAYYDSKGTDFASIEIELNYVTVPLGISYHFGKARNWYINAGGYGSYLISAEDENTGDIKDLVSDIDYGAVVGLGYKIFIDEKQAVFIEYQGTGGVNEVFEESNLSLFNLRNSLNVGVVFIL